MGGAPSLFKKSFRQTRVSSRTARQSILEVLSDCFGDRERERGMEYVMPRRRRRHPASEKEGKGAGAAYRAEV